MRGIVAVDTLHGAEFQFDGEQVEGFVRAEVNRKYGDLDAVLMEGVGHYLHRTRPEQFHPLLLEAIAALTSPLERAS